MRRNAQALNESQHGVEADFAEPAFDTRDVGLRKADEFGDHVLAPDRCACAIELRDLAEIVIGECRAHLRFGPEIEREHGRE
ncbi:hypothetical protein GCM10009539_58420 [Cryptosporangium japonicum]|uniref:Uncharacterized protein n=1 Tax=Cryptosporangium japonicum TaxID=80872 RepID=A0ABN0UXB6_9ACTN